ncbi:hypothetical protein GCM10010521_11150 [Streptomyces rameus]|uniref:Uncharacterized protein n=1 Tax=Streptomyces rameus TaxID=68261 RepID=A0ABP6MWM5_9ACTN
MDTDDAPDARERSRRLIGPLTDQTRLRAFAAVALGARTPGQDARTAGMACGNLPSAAILYAISAVTAVSTFVTAYVTGGHWYREIRRRAGAAYAVTSCSPDFHPSVTYWDGQQTRVVSLNRGGTRTAVNDGGRRCTGQRPGQRAAQNTRGSWSVPL